MAIFLIKCTINSLKSGNFRPLEILYYNLVISFFIIFKKDGKDVFIELGSWMIHLPPKIKDATTLVIKTLWSFK